MKFLQLSCVSLALTMAFAAPSLALDVKLSNATITTDEGHTRFEMEISQSVGFGATSETGPDRVTLSLPEFTSDTAANIMFVGKGAIISYGIELDAKGKAHIVLNTQKSAAISGSTVLAPKDGKGPRITLDLISMAELGPTDAMSTGAITPAVPLPTAPPARKHMIVIDPGHGGIDPGAVSHNGIKEKEIVLAFAKSLRQALEASGRYEVLLTRSGDSFVKLEDRVKYARDHQAELLIALHADTVDDRDVRGTTVYTVSDKASDAEAEKLARTENGVDNIAGLNLSKQKHDVANALMNLAQRESQSGALNFAQKAVAAIKPVTELPSKPLRSAAFVVLKAPDVPSVLLELGYLSNQADESLLTSVQWRKEMADALTKAVDGYFNIATANAAP